MQLNRRHNSRCATSRRPPPTSPSSAPASISALPSPIRDHTADASIPAAVSSSAGSKRNGATESGVAAAGWTAAPSGLSVHSDADESAAAASASSSPSNSHLASVIDSASAAAPIAKRTMRTQQSAQAAAGRVVASPMLRLLGQDSGARLSLMRMLPLKDLASLVASSQSWRAWIAEEPASMGTQPVTLGSVNSCSTVSVEFFDRCRWLHSSVQSVSFSMWSASDERPQLDQFLRCMPRLARLRSLVLSERDESLPVDLLRAGLSAVSATLTSLQMTKALFGRGQADAAGWWSAIRALKGLLSLEVNLGTCAAESDLDFLPSMRKLDRIHLYCGRRGQPATEQQVESLAQCKAITDLRCGQWITTAELMGSVNSRDLAQQTMVQSRFALLVQRRKENGAAPLRRLCLGCEPVIDPVGWQSLSQCTELEEIEAEWSSTLTVADWARLANFQRLQSLWITGVCEVADEDGPLSDLSHVLPPLVHCCALRKLNLFGKFDLRAEHAALLARIPSLQVLDCWNLRIESLTPLAAAPALIELDFGYCTGINGESIIIREMIPAMALVCKLTISDHLSAQEAAPFDTALLLRLPKLTCVLRG